MLTLSVVAAGVTVRLAALLVPPRPAAIVTDVVVLTGVVVTVNVALVAPAGTVTVVGTDAAALLLDKLTAVDADGAALKVTVPVAVPPPATDGGLSVSPLSVGLAAGCWVMVRAAL
jgi:hypothetical protein